MKKILVTVSTWLRSIVTAISKGEMAEVKGDNNKYVELPTNEACSSSTSHTDPLLLRMGEYVGEHYEVRLNRLSQHYGWLPRCTTICTSCPPHGHGGYRPPQFRLLPQAVGRTSGAHPQPPPLRGGVAWSGLISCQCQPIYELSAYRYGGQLI